MAAKKIQIWHPKNKLYLKDNTTFTILIVFDTILVLPFFKNTKNALYHYLPAGDGS